MVMVIVMVMVMVMVLAMVMIIVLNFGYSDKYHRVSISSTFYGRLFITKNKPQKACCFIGIFK